VASAVLLVGMLVIVATLIWRANQREEVARKVCRSQVAQNAVLRSVLVAGRGQSLRAAANEAQIDRIQQFYDPLLQLVPPLTCTAEGQPVPKQRR